VPFPRALKVGLALGGGAARGLAHIGVLRALLREGIPIDVVTGTSMGALIGGAYAATGDIAVVERDVRAVLGSEQFRRTRLSFLADAKKHRGGLLYSVSRFVRQGLVYGVSTMRESFLPAEEFAASMQSILPEAAIEDLLLPFGAVALDLDAAQEVVLSRGSLREAVQASAAIPGILPPHRLNGRLLVDGGWVDKVPVLPAFRLGADVVIAVDISADLDGAGAYDHGLDVMLRANAIKDIVLVGLQRRLADVLIEPAVKDIHWADFESADRCIDEGERAAVAAAPRIREYLRRQRWRALLRLPRLKRLAGLHFASGDARFAVE
jgi:NTE family protein